MRRVIIAIAGLLGVIFIALAGIAYWVLAGDGARVALEQQASAWLGQPVRIASADVQIFPRVGLQLRDVVVGEPATVMLNAVDVSARLLPVLSRRIEDASITLSDSRVDMPLPFSLGSNAPPSSDTPVSANTPSGSALTVVSVRSIALNNVVIASRGRELRVDADSSLAGSTLTLDRIAASSGATAIEGEGTVVLSPAIDAQLEIDADRLDLDDLVALADAFAPQDTMGGGDSGSADARVVAQVTADSVSAGSLTVPQFATTIRVQGSRLSLSPVRFFLFNGRYEGDVDMSLNANAPATVRAKVDGLDVAQLAAFGGVPDSVTGTMSGSATVTGRGVTMSEILASARGSGTASIVNGTIQRLGLVRTVVLFFGRPAPETQSSTDAFERIDTKFALANGVVTVDALSLRSRDADIVASGTLTLDSKALDGRADLSLSEELSRQAGTDLYRYTREGNRILLPATIGGTLSAPRLSIDAAAAVQRGLRNEVERRLKGLLEGFK